MLLPIQAVLYLLNVSELLLLLVDYFASDRYLVSHTGDKIWWNLSTDAGYQYPPMRFFSTAPGAPNMYCGDPRCPDGTPGDSHINNVGGQYDLVVQYCG